MDLRLHCDMGRKFLKACTLQRFCSRVLGIKRTENRVYEEVHNFFRTRARRNEVVSLTWQRTLHLGRMPVLMATLAVP